MPMGAVAYAAPLGGGEVQQPPPAAFTAFADYVNADVNRLTRLIDGIGSKGANKGSDTSFWESSPISKEQADHFLGDWLGGGYWPKHQGEALYKVLRKAVRDGAELSKRHGLPIDMQLWVDPGLSKVEARAFRDGNLVVIKITTLRPG